MTTEDLDLLRAARPAASGPRLDLVEQQRAQLMKMIRSTRSRWPTKRRVAVGLPALAVVLAAAVVGVAMLTRGGESAWAAALVKVAQSAPRLLPNEPGWHVTQADQLNIDFGEMTLTRQQRQLELRWQPAAAYPAIVQKLALEADLTSSAVIAGNNARVFGDRSADAFNAVWERGDYLIEIGGKAPDLESFKSTLSSFRVVAVSAWLSAMPASVVKPSSRPGIVNQMLADVPLPSGFDVAKLRGGDTVRDRYQLGAQVSGAVGCAWIEQWISAQAAGDDASIRAAAAAMATSHDWAILREMKAEGDYPEILWQYAAAMATNRPLLDKTSITGSYRDALGCPTP